MEKEYELFGIGNVLVDYVAEVEDDFLKKFKLKKGITHRKSMDVVKDLETKLRNIKKYPGGSASNTIHGVANLGLKTAFAGSAAKDENGESFVNELGLMGIKDCVTYKKGKTSVAITLVTPDGERTFVIKSGVSSDYASKDIDKEILAKSKYIHFTGYEFESLNKAINRAVNLSKKYGTKISFDLGDPNVVLRNKEKLEKFLKKVYVVFASEDEAKNFTGEENPEKALDKLANYCEIAVVKIGKKGSLVKSGNRAHKIKGYKAKLVNTIGAGDGFTSGFLYGMCKNHSLEDCCKIGNFYASKIVEETGARLSYNIDNLEMVIDQLVKA